MANKILGITIDIEGKTSGLTKSLQEANSSINKTTSALKDVDKALKLDPTNVELIAQKEALLNKQIEQTSEKLDIMRQVADDANAALERGDISQEQYASLTAEIVRTEQSLAGLEEEANNSADALRTRETRQKTQETLLKTLARRWRLSERPHKSQARSLLRLSRLLSLRRRR